MYDKLIMTMLTLMMKPLKDLCTVVRLFKYKRQAEAFGSESAARVPFLSLLVAAVSCLC